MTPQVARAYPLPTISLLIACPPSHNESWGATDEKNGPKYAGNRPYRGWYRVLEQGIRNRIRLLYCGRVWRRRRSWIQAALAFSESILAGRSSLVSSSICLYQTLSPLRSSTSPSSALRRSSSAIRSSSSCDSPGSARPMARPNCPFLRCSSSLRSTSMYCSHSSWCVLCDSSSIRFLLPVFDQPSTLGAVLNHTQHAPQAEFSSTALYIHPRRSGCRSLVRSTVKYMIGTLHAKGSCFRGSCLWAPVRRSIGGQLVYAPRRGRILRRRDRSTLRACLFPTRRLRCSHRRCPAPRPQPREPPAGDTRAQEPATGQDRHRARAASGRGDLRGSCQQAREHNRLGNRSQFRAVLGPAHALHKHTHGDRSRGLRREPHRHRPERHRHGRHRGRTHRQPGGGHGYHPGP